MRIKYTKFFDKWISKIKDQTLIRIVNKRLIRLRNNDYGDYKIISKDLIEFRIFYGPGIRIYATEYHGELIIILCAGDKTTQQHDIERAKQIIKDIKIGID